MKLGYSMLVRLRLLLTKPLVLEILSAILVGLCSLSGVSCWGKSLTRYLSEMGIIYSLRLSRATFHIFLLCMTKCVVIRITMFGDFIKLR